MMERPDMEYVGFWPRVGAAIIDTILIWAITMPALTMIYGWTYWTDGRILHGPAEFIISWVLPIAAVVWLWVARGQTPGKMAIGARIVDAETGEGLSLGTALIRYLGYFVSTIGLFVGFAWVGLDPRKQGWHDHMAGTVVIRKRDRRPEPVAFRDR
jgi:uncharacterized RDD family membrane protein YckC